MKKLFALIAVSGLGLFAIGCAGEAAPSKADSKPAPVMSGPSDAKVEGEGAKTDDAAKGDAATEAPADAPKGDAATEAPADAPKEDAPAEAPKADGDK